MVRGQFRNFSFFLLLCAIVLSIIFPFVVHAETAKSDKVVDKQRIFDFASLLTEQEIENLEKEAKKISDKKEVDFIVLTSNERTDVERFTENFYRDQGIGYDKKQGDAAIITIDIYNREVYLAGKEKAEKTLGDKKLDIIRNKITPDLTNENYYHAFITFFEMSDRYMDIRASNPESPFYKTGIQFLIAIGISALVLFAMVYNRRVKNTTTASTYLDKGKTTMLGKRDQYIRTSLTKTRKPEKDSSSGSSGGSSSGGSSSRGSF